MAFNKDKNKDKNFDKLQIGLWEFENGITKSTFYKGSIDRKTLEKLLNDYPQGCEVYVNENDKGGEKGKTGGTIPYLRITFKPPFTKKGNGGKDEKGGQYEDDEH